MKERLETFKELAQRLGNERVIWRFDPLFLTHEITIDVLLNKAHEIGNSLKDFTSKMVFSFADAYRKTQNNMKEAQWRMFNIEEMKLFAKGLHELNREWKFELSTCAEIQDLDKFGITHNRCIDDRLMTKVFSYDKTLMKFLGNTPMAIQTSMFQNEIPDKAIEMKDNFMKDKGQRKECGCMVSKDIGMYNTCPHLCNYCYANISKEMVNKNVKKHNFRDEGILKK